MRRFVVLVLAGCNGTGSSTDSGSPGTTYAPVIDPASFGTTIDNPYFPLTPGTTLHYAESVEEGQADTAYAITTETRVVMGVTCVQVHDVTTIGTTTLEDTLDWYAQDLDGNVWYFGEDTTAYDNGVPDTSGSWEGGVDGAYPGILMEAHPAVGDSYRQEYYAGEAEDEAEVVALGEAVTVTAGSYSDTVKTDETTALEPDLVETKWYARGIGEVKAVDRQGGSDTSELVEVTTE